MENGNIRKSGMNNLLQREKTKSILGEFVFVKKVNLHKVWTRKFQYFANYILFLLVMLPFKLPFVAR